MGDAYAGQLSPDGRWRWDGTAWRPAGALYPAWARLGMRGQATWVMVAGAVVPRRTRVALAREFEGSEVPMAASHFPDLRFGRLLPGTGMRRWVFD